MKTTPLVITTSDVGIHFGTIAEVRRERDRRIIHRTDPRPYGFHRAAVCDGIDWAIAHGYSRIDDGQTGVGA